MTDPPILGMDIDGVLNRKVPFVDRGPNPDPREFIDRALVALLNSALPEGTQVVIVSGWRRYFDPPTLRSILGDVGLAAPVVDVVGGLKMSGDLRAEAFEWYVTTNAVERYAVIDDTPSLWGLKWYPRQGAPDATVAPQTDSEGRAYGGTEWLRGRIVCPVDGITPADAAALTLAFDGQHFGVGGLR